MTKKDHDQDQGTVKIVCGWTKDENFPHPKETIMTLMWRDRRQYFHYACNVYTHDPTRKANCKSGSGESPRFQWDGKSSGRERTFTVTGMKYEADAKCALRTHGAQPMESDATTITVIGNDMTACIGFFWEFD